MKKPDSAMSIRSNDNDSITHHHHHYNFQHHPHQISRQLKRDQSRSSTPQLFTNINAQQSEQRARKMHSQIKSLQSELIVSNDIIKEMMAQKMNRERNEQEVIKYLTQHQAFVSKTDRQLNQILQNVHQNIEEISGLQQADKSIINSFSNLSAMLDSLKDGNQFQIIQHLKKKPISESQKTKGKILAPPLIKKDSRPKISVISQQLSQIPKDGPNSNTSFVIDANALLQANQQSALEISQSASPLQFTGLQALSHAPTISEKQNLNETELEQQENIQSGRNTRLGKAFTPDKEQNKKASLLDQINNILTDREKKNNTKRSNAAIKNSSSPLLAMKKQKK